MSYARIRHPWARHATALVAVALFAQAGAASATAPPASDDLLWHNGLRTHFFGDRAIEESDELIELHAPVRADNGAIVPISITSKIEQNDERYVKTIWLIADKNPGPLAGKFNFTPRSGKADLALRMRVNEYMPVRAVAETSDGKLYMSRRFVKASGGCSAPAGTDADAALARLGKMKIREIERDEESGAQLLQLMVSHPNFNGMQMDQMSRLYTPAHFVRQVSVKYAGEEIFSAETSFAISENPSFRFYFVPEGDGELTAHVTDTKDMEFTHSYNFGQQGAVASQAEDAEQSKESS